MTTTLALTAPAAETSSHPTLVFPAVVTKGWHADPMRIHKMRWHDGAEWTEHVTHFGPVPCQHCGI